MGTLSSTIFCIFRSTAILCSIAMLSVVSHSRMYAASDDPFADVLKETDEWVAGKKGNDGMLVPLIVGLGIAAAVVFWLLTKGRKIPDGIYTLGADGKVERTPLPPASNSDPYG